MVRSPLGATTNEKVSRNVLWWTRSWWMSCHDKETFVHKQVSVNRREACRIALHMDNLYFLYRVLRTRVPASLRHDRKRYDCEQHVVWVQEVKWSIRRSSQHDSWRSMPIRFRSKVFTSWRDIDLERAEQKKVPETIIFVAAPYGNAPV